MTEPAAVLELLYEDDCLLVLNKPAGLLSVPGRGPGKQDCLSARALRRYPDASIVHRLDMGTSGIFIMARGAQAQRSLNQAFALRQITKRYQARVHGVLPVDPDPDRWEEIDLPIALDWLRRPLSVIDPLAGKPSLTRWRCLGVDRDQHSSLLLLQPVTGRSHQLRVHLSAIGHPILGDALYAPALVQPGGRLLLHACEILLPHPATGRDMGFVSPTPF